MKKVFPFAFLFVALIGICLVLFAISQEDKSNADTKIKTVSVATPQELLSEVNKQRALTGLGPVDLDPRLNHSALAKAEDMKKFSYFEHKSPITGKNGYDWVDETGLKCKPGSPAENIQENRGDMDAQHIVDEKYGGWMASKLHREAILNNGIDIVGFGIVDKYVVMHFCDLVD